jgi:metal-dependent amidase/aminoacylase/carboxypeptidase family protein
VYIRKALSGTAEEIAKDAKEIAEGIAFSKHSEVRWNYAGQSQGHYQDEIFPDEEIIVREERILLLPAPKEVEVVVQ